MTTSDSDQDKENESTADRLDEIKKEEQEDASSYYAQGNKGSTMNVKEEFEAPVPPVDKSKEDLNLLRAVAFLGFGLAALAIVFILFFIRDLDERVGGMDSAVKKVEESIEPLKTDVEGSKASVQAIEESLSSVTATVSKLQGKFGSYEKTMAIMELKRALAMIQGISAGSDAGVQSKSSEIAASINSLLSELGGGVSNQPAGEIQVEEAAEDPAEEESAEEATEEAAEEPAEEESAEEATEEAEEEPAEEESAEEATEEAEEEPAEEESAEEATEEAAEEPAEEESAEEATEEAPAEASSHEEAPQESAGHGDESTDGVEELPTVEELLKE
jgi:chromosome segregation ATPase